MIHEIFLSNFFVTAIYFLLCTLRKKLNILYSHKYKYS